MKEERSLDSSEFEARPRDSEVKMEVRSGGDRPPLIRFRPITYLIDYESQAVLIAVVLEQIRCRIFGV